MKSILSAISLGALLTVPVTAQNIRASYTAPAAPPPIVVPGDGGTVLWSQLTLGVNAWVDQAFSDFSTYSSFEVNDISTGGAVWNVNKVTTYYTKGAGGGGTLDLWSPASMTTGGLNVFPKTGALPVNLSDVPPEYTVPITMVVGAAGWEISADTTGIAELQCISGDYWIGLTPNTSFAVNDQEFRWVATPVVGDLTAIRNPLGAFGFGTTWAPLSALDVPVTVGPPYEAAILLEGDVLGPTWSSFPGTGVVSPFWGVVPVLIGTGISCAGQPVTISGTFNGFSPFDMTGFVVGGPLFVPFKGGTLVPAPSIVYFIPVGPVGDFFIPTIWPPGIPPGFTIYFQTWTNEGGGTLGWSGSDGLAVVSQ